MFTSIGAVFLFSLVLVERSHEDSLMFERSCWEANIIPYYVGEGFRRDQLLVLYRVFAVFHKDTCLRWVNYGESETRGYLPTHHVQFIKVSDGICLTRRKRKDNGTVITYVNLLDKCFTQYSLMHELMHVLGFHHEHQRRDRNCYVSVVSGAEVLDNYKLIPHEPWIERYPYDKYSVLHYPHNFIMQTRKNGRRFRTDFLGNAYGQLTHLDLSKILFKFCGGPHYCDRNPEDCRRADEFRRYRCSR